MGNKIIWHFKRHFPRQKTGNNFKLLILWDFISYGRQYHSNMDHSESKFKERSLFERKQDALHAMIYIAMGCGSDFCVRNYTCFCPEAPWDQAKLFSTANMKQYSHSTAQIVFQIPSHSLSSFIIVKALRGGPPPMLCDDTIYRWRNCDPDREMDFSRMYIPNEWQSQV